ncbi:MAG: UDP-N-acetylglucosamine 1-carboxyvinyltransferase [Deferribacteraceae bacterium]|jgi:UDP-N-acetylglucosamine 1-carboxyvinyltransferase|nr:UDP-N-acetylglucosamine 1-carboxyvinyltransferase [Deferribacteraceae bacterium]
MYKLIIKGGAKLSGAVSVGGAKNASLPILAATLLAEGQYILRNVPKLHDIGTMSKLLSQLDVQAECDKNSRFCGTDGIDICLSSVNGDLLLTNNGGARCEALYEVVKTMRASILALGPLLAKRSKARVSLPGGCAIGERPVDLHISALEAMGADIKVSHGYIDAECSRLKGADITFKTITVTGTENIMMAAVLADGVTVLQNAAQEPEIVDLANFLRRMGAKITGDGTHCIQIEGVDKLRPADYSVMPDRIEAGTFLCAVAGAGGGAVITGAPVAEMKALISSLKSAGVKITDKGGGDLFVESDGVLNATDVTTMPYPGFPTDMQAQFMAVMTKAVGTSLINETIFENRFMHVAELKRMGADITVKDSSAVVRGVKELSGAQVMASDLRASAGLVIAALMASNTSEVQRIYHLDRGYEDFEKKLALLGADIKRVKAS